MPSSCSWASTVRVTSGHGATPLTGSQLTFTSTIAGGTGPASALNPHSNLNQTARIVGLAPQESADLLEALFEHLYREENVYEHRWRNGDLVMWDNLATQHARGNVSGVGRRTLQRVVLATKGFFEQNPQFSPEEFAS